MNKNNGSGSKSSGNQSGGGSQPRGGNRGSGGQSGNSRESPRQIVRELCNEMAKGVAPSYNDQVYIRQHAYEKFMDGGYQ